MTAPAWEDQVRIAISTANIFDLVTSFIIDHGEFMDNDDLLGVLENANIIKDSLDMPVKIVASEIISQMED